MKPDVYLIDASIFVFRSYYSLPDTFRDGNGEVVNAVYGFAGFLTRLLQQTGARHVGVVFDESLQGSFRNDIYPPYKANREPAPPELKAQFVRCRELAETLGLATFSDDEYEADDLIGTLASVHRRQGFATHVISADKDLAQLVENDSDRWWNFGKDAPLDPRAVEEKFGVRPDQIADFLALTGDSVDNIPGVPGIGPKTAIILLRHFGDLENILRRSEEIGWLSFRGAKSCEKKIRQYADDARLARQLTGIVCDAPMQSTHTERHPADQHALNTLFEALNFGPLLRRKLFDLC